MNNGAGFSKVNLNQIHWFLLPNDTKGRRKRCRNKGFPLPGSSYKELIKIIQAYGEVGEDAGLSAVAKIAAMNESVVSMNNRFLVEIGIVQGGKKKTVTTPGRELTLALLSGMEDEISIKWRWRWCLQESDLKIEN